MTYANFTDRLRRVMQLANMEAQRFNHEYIATEHMLLGFVKEGSGLGAEVLKGFADLRAVRLEVEKLMQSGPHMVTMGKLPQTPLAKKVLERSIEQASAFGHGFVDTEHFLLGMLIERESVASEVLNRFGVTLPLAREAIVAALKPKSPMLAMMVWQVNIDQSFYLDMPLAYRHA